MTKVGVNLKNGMMVSYTVDCPQCMGSAVQSGI